MKSTIKLVRIAGCLAGLWLIASSAIGTRQIMSFYSGSPSVSALGMAFHLFGSAVLLGVMLLLPWSRMRLRGIWIPAFLTLLGAGGAYLWKLCVPFSGTWRPLVLLDQGILQILIMSAVFVFVQFGSIVLLRFRGPSGEASMS